VATQRETHPGHRDSGFASAVPEGRWIFGRRASGLCCEPRVVSLKEWLNEAASVPDPHCRDLQFRSLHEGTCPTQLFLHKSKGGDRNHASRVAKLRARAIQFFWTEPAPTLPLCQAPSARWFLARVWADRRFERYRLSRSLPGDPRKRMSGRQGL